MNEIQKRMYEIGIIPVIAMEDANLAVPLANALVKGGIPAAEVTFRTAAGEEAIRQMAQNCPEILVGAGTILNVEQAQRAINAGAKFIVSPGFIQEVIDFCQEQNVPIFPGCVNASDMTRACNSGLEIVKFFPAEASGGLAMIKNLAPVFPKLKFMPTGGVNTKNLLSYLSYDRIIGCGGTWMVKKDLIEGQKWDEITAICKDAVKTMLGFHVKHVGINCPDEAEAAKTAKTICTLFGFEYKEGNSSIFCSDGIECMKAPYLGKMGHIAIGTNNVDRAVAKLAADGVEFDEATRKTDAKGNTKAIYLKGDFCGFALHLVQA